MSGRAEDIADSRHADRAEARSFALTTAFRSGTGGLHVTVVDDRIVTHRRDGRAAEIPIEDIVSVSLFESGASQPVYGVHFVVKSPPRDVGYRFDDDITRLAFLRAVQRRMRRHTM